MADSTTTTGAGVQEEKLRSEMKQDAQRKSGRIVNRARRDAKKVLDEVRKEAAEQRRVRLAVAKHHAEDRVSAILAGVEHEKRRRHLLAREEIIEAALSAALEKAESTRGQERVEVLKALLSEAIADFEHESLAIHCSPGDASLLNEAADALPEGVQAVADDSVEGGILLVFEDGVRRYENTFEARLRRLRDHLRTVAYAALAGQKPTRE